MTMPLPLRVPRRDFEPAHGLLLRLAARHAIPPATLGRLLFVSVPGLTRGKGVDQLANYAGHDLASLAQASPQVAPRRRTVSLLGETFRLGDWSIRSRRWCAACLQADTGKSSDVVGSVHRTVWDLGSVGACLEHGTLLTNLCPRCGAICGWNDPGVGRCRCGAHLMAADMHIAAEDDRLADRYIGGRLGLCQRAVVSFLDVLPLTSVPALIERLGTAALFGLRSRRPVLSEALAMRAASEGVRIAIAFESRFPALLDHLLRSRPARSVGLTASYGWVFSRWLADSSGDQTGGLLQAALRAHAVANGIIASDETRLGVVAGRGPICLIEAAATLGMGHARARKTLLQAALIANGFRPGVAAVLDAQGVADLADAIKATCDATEARSLLGIGKQQFNRMVRKGLIKPAEISGIGGAARFIREQITSFTPSLCAAAATRSASRIGWMPLPRACRSAGVHLTEACIAIRNGSVAAIRVKSGSNRLADVAVRLVDLAQLRPPRTDTVRAVAFSIGVHQEAVRALARHGAFSNRQGNLICDEGVRRFREAYVTASEVAASTGLSPRRTRALLAEENVAAAYGPPLCRQIFYERERAVAAMRSCQADRSGIGRQRDQPERSRHN